VAALADAVYSSPMATYRSVGTVHSVRRTVLVALAWAVVTAAPAAAQIHVTAEVPPATPAWDKGIQPISPAGYYDAIACGKEPGKSPACVFWDTGLCRNADYTLAMYTPYKMVAYEVWRVIQNGQPAPQPSYQEAQRTNVTIGVTPVRGADNPIDRVIVRRGGRTIQPISRSMEGAGGRFTFAADAFAATSAITIDLIGQKRTVSCAVAQAVLARFR
jgi:hypothetical protein